MLRQLKIPNAPLPLFLRKLVPPLVLFLSGQLLGLLGPLQLPLLRKDVGQGAFATEDIATLAGYGFARRVETETAGAEGEEGIAVQARSAGVPVSVGEGALMRGEDGAGWRCQRFAARFVGGISRLPFDILEA